MKCKVNYFTNEKNKPISVYRFVNVLFWICFSADVFVVCSLLNDYVVLTVYVVWKCKAYINSTLNGTISLCTITCDITTFVFM